MADLFSDVLEERNVSVFLQVAGNLINRSYGWIGSV
jgi:hypothetical protein